MIKDIYELLKEAVANRCDRLDWLQSRGEMKERDARLNKVLARMVLSPAMKDMLTEDVIKPLDALACNEKFGKYVNRTPGGYTLTKRGLRCEIEEALRCLGITK